MKKLLTYISVLLTVALLGTVSACIEDIQIQKDLGLNVKVFFPTKVVPGVQMTINGTGFSNVREIVFPDNVTVTDFKLVSDDMIRVTAPAGFSAGGGKLILRTADDQAESRLPLTLGSTEISGYSKQDGESIQGGEQLTIYGKDLEFISGVELLDADGNPILVKDVSFYRKGTSSVIIYIPKKVYEGTFVGKVYTFDGKVFDMPELSYTPASEGGHWEKVKTTIWKNDGSHGAANWDGVYRFGLEGNDTNNECIATFPAEIWNGIKSGTFYMLAQGSDWVQMRITTGWWSTNWTGDDIMTGNERIIDNGDGTYYIAINFEGDPILDVLDAQHLLFTGSGFTPLELYFEEDVWVDGGGHWEIVKTSFWKNDGSHGAANWDGVYRFGLEGNDTNNECLATFPEEIWNGIKSGTFYMLAQGSDWVQMRITTGWWSTNWTGDDIMTGNERIIDNGDGTYYIAINFEGDPILDVLDAQHLLFTGSGFTPLELYFEEEVWVDEGGSGAQEVVFWQNDGSHGAANWDGVYRFGLEGNDINNECLATFPADVWNVIKSGTFYMLAQGSDWVQMRITTGWWSTNWTGDDIMTGNERIVDKGDGTYTIEINFEGDPILDVLDAQHLLLTGSGFTPLKLYYIK
ncbi:MAG: IPT/TIG domain-containing protein [Bacteroidales bacterium]|nr:IPT/TIG domain-containing protein [Bacteroidales bacterium]